MVDVNILSSSELSGTMFPGKPKRLLRFARNDKNMTVIASEAKQSLIGSFPLNLEEPYFPVDLYRLEHIIENMSII